MVGRREKSLLCDSGCELLLLLIARIREKKGEGNQSTQRDENLKEKKKSEMSKFSIYKYRVGMCFAFHPLASPRVFQAEH